MAQFTNQATLSYNGSAVNSNVAVGEILEALSQQNGGAGDVCGGRYHHVCHQSAQCRCGCVDGTHGFGRSGGISIPRRRKPYIR